jgi:uroporphyrin-III C-methyltransferase/precorrin-2 dehydrogenase/sirohydrochlorin ferrochelatase
MQPSPSYHPVFLDLSGRKVLIVGGGAMAMEKLRAFMHTQAQIVVVSPEVTKEIRLWHSQERLTWIEREFVESDLDDAFLIFGADDDLELNRRVSAMGNARFRLSNAVDDQEHCNFISAAIGRRGPIQVAVSSSGCSPAMAQRIRDRVMEEIVTEQAATLARLLGQWRGETKKVLPTYADRQAFWQRVLESDVWQVLDREGEEGAYRRIGELLRGASPLVAEKVGKVHLVGAGPGAAHLLTLRAAELLENADVVLYDRLVDPAVLERCAPWTERIFAGKVRGTPGAERQQWINEILIDRARRGETVVRLKCGDPFVFGRGGEEAIALAEAGVEYEIVPGVSSATAGPGVAGIPVTHRGTSSAYAVFSGHLAEDEGLASIPWAAAAAMPTAIFLMGLENLSVIVSQMVAFGRALETPVALVANATHADERVVTGTLADIVGRAAEISGPTVIVIGPVVSLREALRPSPVAPLAVGSMA